jgi:hypothetical protein|tara:strand:- start:317 stop:697 length:381 start_codon:yes stop_codon:yes gene_type:complete
MFLSIEKRIFLKKLVPGLQKLMRYTGHDQKIGGTPPSNDSDEFIKKRLLTHTQDGRYELSVGKFRVAIDTVDINEILIYLDQISLTIGRAYTMALPDPLLFSKEDIEFVRLIDVGEIRTFTDFLMF